MTTLLPDIRSSSARWAFDCTVHTAWWSAYFVHDNSHSHLRTILGFNSLDIEPHTHMLGFFKWEPLP